MSELCDLPGRHDDQADAAAGAFNEIAAGYSVQAYLDAWGERLVGSPDCGSLAA